MNKIMQWFFKKEKNIRLDEIYKAGLRIQDEDKFDVYVLRATKMNIVYTGLLLGIAIGVVIKWVI